MTFDIATLLEAEVYEHHSQGEEGGAACALLLAPSDESEAGEGPDLEDDNWTQPPPAELAAEWIGMANGIARKYYSRLCDATPYLSWHPSRLDDFAAEARFKLVKVVTKLAGEMATDELRPYAARSIWNHLRDRRKCAGRYDTRFGGGFDWDSLPARKPRLASDRLPDLIAMLPDAFEALRRFRPHLFKAADLGLRQERPGVEVARILNISPRKAQRRLEEAREWLKDWLERYCLD